MPAEETMPEEDKKIVRHHAIVDGVDVKIDGVKDVTVNEIKNYLEVIAKNIPDESRLTTLTISKADEDAKNVALDYSIRSQPMERIRRITGYLVGTVDRWNNAKQAELRDRVKHMTTGMIR